jgi:hypothetical protein
MYNPEAFSDTNEDLNDPSGDESFAPGSETGTVSSPHTLFPPQMPRKIMQAPASATRTPCERAPLLPGHFIEAGSVECAACRDSEQRKIETKVAAGICTYGACNSHLTTEDLQNKHVRCARHREMA